MVIQTRILLASRDCPTTVNKNLFDAVFTYCSTYQYEYYTYPDTVRYYIPSHMVVEDAYQNITSYEIDVDDTAGYPNCHRRRLLDRHFFKRKIPCNSNGFDRIRCYTEEVFEGEYYLLVPNATYYSATIYTNWSVCCLLYDDVTWQINFREVFTDPYRSTRAVWFKGEPRYQIELVAKGEDFRNRTQLLKKHLTNILPKVSMLEAFP